MKDTVIIRRKRVNIIFTIIGLLLICYTIYQGVFDYLQEQKAVSINGKILEVNPTTLGYTAHLTYRVETTTYDQYNVFLGFNNELAVGDYFTVKYNINNPQKLISNDHLIIIAATGTIGFLLTLLCLPKRIKMMKKDSNIRKLKKEGLAITATIQDIIINNQGKKNKGFSPYRLRANYLNPTDNQTYLFSSEDSYLKLNEVVDKYQAKTVKVYLDKNNTSNYYVDLLSLIPSTTLVDPLEYMKQFQKPVKEETTVPPETAEVKEEKK